MSRSKDCARGQRIHSGTASQVLVKNYETQRTLYHQESNRGDKKRYPRAVRGHKRVYGLADEAKQQQMGERLAKKQPSLRHFGWRRQFQAQTVGSCPALFPLPRLWLLLLNLQEIRNKRCPSVLW